MVKYTITKDNLTIYDSYAVPTRRFDRELNRIEAIHHNSDVWKRSRCSMKLEWATHTAAYDLHLFRSHTKDVDINYPLRWWEKILYPIVGVIVWPFID